MSDRNGNAYKVYLEEGPRVFSLSVTMGPQASIYNELQETAYDLGEIYRRISMIVGESPDPNRDYNLFAQIPDLPGASDGRHEHPERPGVQAGGDGGHAGRSGATTLRNMAATIKRMMDYDWQAQKYKSDYYAATAA